MEQGLWVPRVLTAQSQESGISAPPLAYVNSELVQTTHHNAHLTEEQADFGKSLTCAMVPHSCPHHHCHFREVGAVSPVSSPEMEMGVLGEGTGTQGLQGDIPLLLQAGPWLNSSAGNGSLCQNNKGISHSIPLAPFSKQSRFVTVHPPAATSCGWVGHLLPKEAGPLQGATCREALPASPLHLLPHTQLSCSFQL